MILLKRMRYHEFHTLLKLQRPSNYLKNPAQNPYLLAASICSNSLECSFLSSINRRTFSLAALIPEKYEEKRLEREKPLSVFFKEAVVISERIESTGFEVNGEGENRELNVRLRKLAEEVRSWEKVTHERGKLHFERDSGKMRNLAEEVRNWEKETPEVGKKLHPEKHSEKMPNLVEEVRNPEKATPELGKKLHPETHSGKMRKVGKGRLWALFSDKKTEKMKRENLDGLRNEDPQYNLLIDEIWGLKEERHEMGEISGLHSEKLDEEIEKEGHGSLLALSSDKEAKEEMKLLKPFDFRNEDAIVHKELSPDMKMFAEHLHKEGYLWEATFMARNKFDFTLFEDEYAREYLKFAATEFGKDKQEIAKWLSASELKKVALFGCPSLSEKTVRAAKNMRKFFKIEESKVCEKCALKDSCKLANVQSKRDVPKLLLGYVTRVLVVYALESVPRKLVVPDEIKQSVSRLLKEVINLSRTLS